MAIHGMFDFDDEEAIGIPTSADQLRKDVPSEKYPAGSRYAELICFAASGAFRPATTSTPTALPSPTPAGTI